MKIGQVLSFLDVGLVPEEYREEFQAKLAELRDAAPKVSFKDMKKVLESEYGEKLDEVFESLRPGADRRRVDRPGLQGHARRRAPRRGQGPVPRRRRRGPRRHAEPGRDHAPAQVGLPGPRRQGDGRRDPRAHPRGARLRARGVQPEDARAHLQRPPVHLHPRRHHVALAREGRRQRVRRRPRVRGAQAAPAGGARPDRRDHLPLLLRLDVPPPAVLRRPAPRQLDAAWTTGGWRSSTSGCSSASRSRSPTPSCASAARGSRSDAERAARRARRRRLPPRPDGRRRREAARPVPRPDVVVHGRRGGRSSRRRSRRR